MKCLDVCANSPTSTIRSLPRTVRRICILILGLEGLKALKIKGFLRKPFQTIMN